MGTKFTLGGGWGWLPIVFILTKYTVIQDIKLRLQLFRKGGGGLKCVKIM